MDDKTFKDRVSKLQEVNSVIAKLDPSIRAEAFLVLKDYVLGSKKGVHAAAEPQDDGGDNGSAPEMEDFFKTIDDKKPSDNALAVAAYFFSQHGKVPISLQVVKDIAADAGIAVPDRIDMTLASAQKGGKKFFNKAGRGSFTPTVHGITYFKDTYNVRPGKKPVAVPKADK